MLYGLQQFLPALLKRKNIRCLSILIYHQVLETKDYLRPGEPSKSEFEWQMKLLRKYFVPLSLSEALARLDNDTLPSNAVCVTFDDGYANNLELALPVLKKWEIPATIFIATGFLNRGRMWNDTIIESIRTTKNDSWDMERLGLGILPLGTQAERREAASTITQAVKHLPFEVRAEETANILRRSENITDNLMLTDEQVRKLHSEGVEIGGHTVNHPILTRISPEEAEQEIRDGRIYLQNLLDSEIPFFAYPNGQIDNDYNNSHVELVKSLGFSAAVSTNHGVSTKSSDIYQLNRFTPWDKTPPRFYARLLMNMS